ncbi:hypothetical protein [Sphingomonas sp. Y38-1Y]|uniref:hypothetical protein n=1 Tax=Sphingomonas sp. Y38-1Y TaxID=3078265 RepID=UPI0028EB85DA|nr:hypothetical protein [Sphingomonas sp. Y38-1Y]
MVWRILPHATCCRATDKLFLLDLRQDRYFCVPEKLAATMLAWLECGFSCAPPKAVNLLLERSRTLRTGDPEATNALREHIAIPEHIDELARARAATSASGLATGAIASRAVAISVTGYRKRQIAGFPLD